MNEIQNFESLPNGRLKICFASLKTLIGLWFTTNQEFKKSHCGRPD